MENINKIPSFRILNYLKPLVIIWIVLAAFSCDSYLDRAPELPLDEEAVFTVFSNAERYHNDLYDNLQARFNAVGDYQPVPISSASDESDSPLSSHGTQSFNMGNYDGNDADLNYYEGIRKVNIFLTKTAVIPFPSEPKKNQMLGEAYFLRAFYFNEIIKRFGGMPIMDENRIVMPGDNMSFPRDSYKDCVHFILGDLQKAIQMLPVALSETEYGRATQGAAMALKARVLLFAASPLWQKEMNENLWQQAAEAAKAVIDLKDENGAKVYELYSTGSGADDYEQLFFKRRETGNKEIIFYKHASPVGFESNEIKVWSPAGGNLGGNGAVCPTQNFVNLFEMANGKQIGDENSTYDEQNPYANRDPRFYKIILYNGCQWQGETLDLTYNSLKDLSGTHRQTKEMTRTGYFVRKYLPEDVKYKTTNTAYHNWIYFRLAEMYLNYAEALNETLAAPSKEVYDAVNAVRSRSGVVDLPAGLNKEQMQQRIWNERAIELSFEEHRWWDARRWKKASEWFGGAMYEMEITKENGKPVYAEKPFYTRIYRSYMDLYPIPTGEMKKNPLYYQNPGW
jgi:hypothetical protein